MIVYLYLAHKKRRLKIASYNRYCIHQKKKNLVGMTGLINHEKWWIL